MFSLDHIQFSYRAKALLDDISLTIKKGEALAVAGPNGCGKTTLLKIMASLIKPLSGEIKVDSDVKRGLYLPNHFFYRSLTLKENLNFYRDLSKSESLEKLVAHFDLKSILNQKVSTLSLGEKARGLLARLFLVPADLYLLDEPLLALDAAHLNLLIDYLKQVKSTGASLVIVSHDLHPIQGLLDQTLSLQNGRLL